MTKQPNKPIGRRRCVACGEFKDKAELWRLARQPGGSLICLDESQKMPGYGIYFCRKTACGKDFLSGKKFKKRYHSNLEPDVQIKLNDWLAKLSG